MTGFEVAPRRPPAPTSASPAASTEAKLTIRRLKTQLAQASARIEELQASADTDFLLDIPNRRGFERELHRMIVDINSHYLLVYQSHGNRSGWRSIAIRPRRRNIEIVNARRGYFAE